MGEGLGGQIAAGGGADLAVVGLQLFEQRIQVRRVGDDGDVGVVLGGGADHRRAADIDVLDTSGAVGAGGQRGGEWVQVANQQVDAGDGMVSHGLAVAGVVAAGQDGAVDCRV